MGCASGFATPRKWASAFLLEWIRSSSLLTSKKVENGVLHLTLRCWRRTSIGSRLFFRPGHGSERPHWLAGHVRFEPANPSCKAEHAPRWQKRSLLKRSVTAWPCHMTGAGFGVGGSATRGSQEGADAKGAADGGQAPAEATQVARVATIFCDPTAWHSTERGGLARCRSLLNSPAGSAGRPPGSKRGKTACRMRRRALGRRGRSDAAYRRTRGARDRGRGPPRTTVVRPL